MGLRIVGRRIRQRLDLGDSKVDPSALYVLRHRVLNRSSDVLDHKIAVFVREVGLEFIEEIVCEA